MGGVIITLTRGMGEPTYHLPQTHCRPMCLGGLLFGGRRFCTKDSFAGHSGLCCGEFGFSLVKKHYLGLS